MFYIYFLRLGSACSHLAALLFKLQACALMELNKVACTSKVCESNAARKKAYPVPLKNLDFKRPNKGETVPRMDAPFTGTLKGYSTPDPIQFITQKDKEDLEAYLENIVPDVAVFNTLRLWGDSSEEGSSTDAADETEKIHRLSC